MGGARGARRRWRRLRAGMRGRMPREESVPSPLHGSHFKEPQFQRVTPVSRAVWLRFTDVERQTVCSSKGQLPTVTSRSALQGSNGARTCVMALMHRSSARCMYFCAVSWPPCHLRVLPAFAAVSCRDTDTCHGGSDRLRSEAAAAICMLSAPDMRNCVHLAGRW